MCSVSRGSFSPPRHQRFMAVHAEDSLGSTRITKVVNLSFTVATLEAVCTKGLISSENSEVFDFAATRTAAVGAIVADEGAIAEEEKVRVRVQVSAARMAAEAVDMPSVTSCKHNTVSNSSSNSNAHAYAHDKKHTHLTRRLSLLQESSTRDNISADSNLP